MLTLKTSVGFDVKDFDTLREAFWELEPQLVGKEVLFLLDEVQNIQGWERFCRRLVEREKVRVCVSGSSSKVMPTEIHTELRGRAWSVELMPFSFREYLRSKGIDPADRKIAYGHQKVLVKKCFSEYMRWGGFPETVFVDSELDKERILKEYMGAMFFRDIVERYSATNIPLLEALTDKLFSSFSMKISLTQFYKQYKGKFPFSKDMLFKYYKYFLKSMLVSEVRVFEESTYKRMRNPAKIYLIDTGICRRVTSMDAGRILENIVYLELRRRKYDIFYFQGRNECDFIAKKADSFLPIQVTFELTNDNKERETEGVIEACKRLHVGKGMLLTNDDEVELTKEGVALQVMPVWKWLLQ